jgi:hypothetical protein
VRVFDNGAMRKMFGTTREKVTGGYMIRSLMYAL